MRVRTKSHLTCSELEKDPPPSNEKSPYLPHPGEAVDIPSIDGAKFDCEIDEYSNLVAEMKKAGVVRDHRRGILCCTREIKVNLSSIFDPFGQTIDTIDPPGPWMNKVVIFISQAVSVRETRSGNSAKCTLLGPDGSLNLQDLLVRPHFSKSGETKQIFTAASILMMVKWIIVTVFLDSFTFNNLLSNVQLLDKLHMGFLVRVSTDC